MGIVLTSRLVMTCAHVINRARGLSPSTELPPEPAETFTVTLPFLSDPQSFSGTVVGWHPMARREPADIAVLKLDREMPRAAGVAVLVAFDSPPREGEEVNVYGFQDQLQFGNHVDTRLVGAAIDGVIQIEGDSVQGAFIAPGYSGGAAWSAAHRAVIGMIIARLADATGRARVAYLISTAAIVVAEPGLPYEQRRSGLPPKLFRRLWTLTVLTWSALLINHFLITIGGSPAPLLALSAPTTPLSAFAGMHLFALVAPLVFWVLRTHAVSHSLHDWSGRIPSFSIIGAAWSTRRLRRPLASIMLALVVVLPIYLQGHFLRKFHCDGSVFAKVEKFFPSGTTGLVCLPRDPEYCHVNGAGIYELVRPAGSARGGYGNDYYRYGSEEPVGKEVVTFFPILQPVALELLSAVAVLLAISVVNHVFGPWRRLDWLERLLGGCAAQFNLCRADSLSKEE